MKDSNYFEYHRIYTEINEILCDAEAIVKSKAAPKNIWKIYQRILEYECLSEELKDHLYDVSSEIPSTLSNTDVGHSQTPSKLIFYIEKHTIGFHSNTNFV